MKCKKLLALMISGLMTVSLMTACGSASDGANENPSVSDTSEGNEADDIASGETEAASDLSQQEPYTVRIMMFDDGDTDIVEEVSEAASKITLEKFNTTVELVRVGWGSWAQQVTLALTSGEKLDLYPAFAINIPLATLVNNGEVLPMTDYLKNGCAKETYDMVDKEDWICTT